LGLIDYFTENNHTKVINLDQSFLFRIINHVTRYFKDNQQIEIILGPAPGNEDIVTGSGGTIQLRHSSIDSEYTFKANTSIFLGISKVIHLIE
jgi:hypothetical protein